MRSATAGTAAGEVHDRRHTAEPPSRGRVPVALIASGASDAGLHARRDVADRTTTCHRGLSRSRIMSLTCANSPAGWPLRGTAIPRSPLAHGTHRAIRRAVLRSAGRSAAAGGATGGQVAQRLRRAKEQHAPCAPAACRYSPRRRPPGRGGPARARRVAPAGDAPRAITVDHRMERGAPFRWHCRAARFGLI